MALLSPLSRSCGPDGWRMSESSDPDRYRSTAESHNRGWKHCSCVHWRLKALLPKNDEDVFLSYKTSGYSNVWLELQLECRPRETPLRELWRSSWAFSEALEVMCLQKVSFYDSICFLLLFVVLFLVNFVASRLLPCFFVTVVVRLSSPHFVVLLTVSIRQLKFCL